MSVNAATEQLSRLNPQDALASAAYYLTRPVRLIREYDRQNLRPDLIAGLTVGVTLLPQAIAFTLIAGLPPATGLYAAIVGGLGAALFGSSNQVLTSPTNTISALVLSTLSGIAVVGSPDYILAAGMLAVMVGAFQLLLGMARLGALVNFVSYSVIVGFATGAGLLIAVRQIAPLLGLSFESTGVISTLTGVATHLVEIDWATAIIGVGSIVLLVILRHVNERLPAGLIVMVLATAVVYLLGLEEQGVATIGPLPNGLPPLARLPIFDSDMIVTLAAGAVAVAAISLVQTTAVSKSIAAQTRQRLDNNQEFVGQGVANLFAGFFSGYPVAGSFSASAVNFRSGARTSVAALVSSLFILLAMQAFAPAGAYLPVAALSGALIVTAYGMIDQDEIMHILRGGRGDAVIMIVTLLGTLFLSLDLAVMAGIGLSLARYILHTSTPRVQAVVPDASFEHFVCKPEAPRCPQLGIVEILGDLYFGAVNHVEDYILEDMAAHPGQRFLLLRLQNVNNLDFSGIHMLESVVQSYRDIGGDVYLWHVVPGVMERMHDAEFDAYLGLDHFLDEDTAISQMFYHVLDPAICIYECPVRVFKECQNLPKRLDLVNLNLADMVPAEGLPEMDAQALWTALHGRDPATLPVVVDVREPREFRQGHIAEALSLPLSTFASETPALPHDRPIVIVCRSSRRSRLAAASLQRGGYEHVALLNGGMLAWEKAGLLEAVDSFADNGELE